MLPSLHKLTLASVGAPQTGDNDEDAPKSAYTKCCVREYPVGEHIKLQLTVLEHVYELKAGGSPSIFSRIFSIKQEFSTTLPRR